MTGIDFARRPVIIGIVEQHAEDAAFLWTQRDLATDSSTYAPRHLARLEARISAHLAGLNIAGEVGADLAAAQWTARKLAGESFVYAVLAFQAHDSGRIEMLVTSASGKRDVLRGLSGALGWCDAAVIGPIVKEWRLSADPMKRLLCLCACSHHRAEPGDFLIEALSDSDERIRARALRLVGELGRRDLLGQITDAIDGTESETAFWAAWSALLLGERKRSAFCLQNLAISSSSRRFIALEAVLRGDSLSGAIDFVHRLNKDPALVWLSTLAVGHIGDPAAIPWLIAHMEDRAVARLAGASFTMITGVDPTLVQIDQGSFSSAIVSQEKGRYDDRLTRDFYGGLPWLDAKKTEVWWRSHRDRLRTGVRYVYGQVCDRLSPGSVGTAVSQAHLRATAYEMSLKFSVVLGNWRLRCK